jgi:hypothetical protein
LETPKKGILEHPKVGLSSRKNRKRLQKSSKKYREGLDIIFAKKSDQYFKFTKVNFDFKNEVFILSSPKERIIFSNSLR